MSQATVTVTFTIDVGDSVDKLEHVLRQVAQLAEAQPASTAAPELATVSSIDRVRDAVAAAPADASGPELADRIRTAAGASRSTEQLLADHQRLAHQIADHFFAPGLDRDDLRQEAMLGLREAIDDYDRGQGSFEPFAALCIRRKVITAVKTAKRLKHGPVNDGRRLDQPVAADELDGATLHDQVSDETPIARDPAEILITKEELEHLTEIVQTRLSELERRCVVMRADGVSYRQIAKTIGTSERSVDNALQRARGKLSQPLEPAAPLVEKQEPAAPTPAPAAPPARSRTAPVALDSVPCKVDHCTGQGPRMGAWAKLCPTHVDHICNGGRVTIDGLEYRRKQPRGLLRVYTADEIPVDQAAIAERLNAPLVKCPYCQEKRSQRHVDQHTQQVDRERARQEAERAKVAHLARPSGVGGAA
jgi:RNA polymerase sporulation-specific sigma factor